MPLYRPPLRLRSSRDIGKHKELKEAINGFTFDYFYTGEREGKSDNINLNVVTQVMDWQENIFIRECEYSGQKHEWKEAINNQLIKHLKDIGIEEGFVNSETRYFEVSKENHFPLAKYEMKLLDLIAKANRAEE